MMINGQNYAPMMWWIENTEKDGIRRAFAELRLWSAYEAEAKAEGDEGTADIYCHMLVGASIVLAMMAEGEGRYHPSHTWTNLASELNRQAKTRGEERITTATGSARLV